MSKIAGSLDSYLILTRISAMIRAHMKHRKIIILLSTIGALLLAGASGLALTHQTLPNRVSLAFSVAVVLLSILAIPLFLSGLEHFKVELRKAYVKLCIGIGLLGLAQIQLPLVSLYEVSFWADFGLIGIPYLVSIIFIFISIRSLSNLLDIKSIWRSWLLALSTTLVVSIIVAFLPHLGGLTDELSYDLANAVIIWDSVFITFTAILAYMIGRKIGVVYEKSMTWLFSAFAVLSFAAWHYVAVRLLFTAGDWYFDYSIVIVPFIFGALNFIIAGYTFGAINISAPRPSVQELIAKKLVAQLTPAQEVDVVMYMTNLVSNPADINSMIEKVRVVAQKIQSTENPQIDDMKKLAELYNELEEYLIHRDSLRLFTFEELRTRISKKFNLSSSVQTTLWTYTANEMPDSLHQRFEHK